MPKTDFKEVAADKRNPRYEEFTRRENGLYSEKGEVRSPFARDYTRGASLYGVPPPEA